MVHLTSTRPKIMVTTDGAGVVSHAGSRLLCDLADTTTLTDELSTALGVRGRRRAHDPGRVLADMAVAVADGARTISDVAVLEHQPTLFGPVASDSTCWRLLDRIDDAALAGIARARAAAREVVWAQHAESRGRAFPTARAAGRDLPGLVLDLDASIVLSHSEKEQAAPTYKATFGYHPMLAFLDNTGEFLAGELRRGNAGANTAAGAPRGASSYPQRSWEELGRRFLGLVAYLDPKGEGDNSMPVKQRSVQALEAARCGTRVIWPKLHCLNPNLQLMQGVIHRKDARNRCHVLCRHIGGVDATSRA